MDIYYTFLRISLKQETENIWIENKKNLKPQI